MSAHLSNQAGGNLAAVDAGLSRPKRRVLLRQGLAAALALASPGLAQAALALRSGEPAEIAFYNTHTSERLELVYRDASGYLPDAMAAVARVLRDHRNDQVKAIDPAMRWALS